MNQTQSNTTRLRRWLLAGLASSAVLLSACSDSDDDDNVVAMAEFTVTITNLSAAQPLSPAAVVVHTEDWQAFTTGTAASTGLEMLAESGANTAYLAEADAASGVVHTVSGSGIIAPGASESLSFQVNANQLGTLSLSMVSMLVNTNDALAAIRGERLATIALNDMRRASALSYDAGTEANSESADTVPGPAASGGAQEGFNAVRDDVRNAVHLHGGVVTQDDGLTGSALAEIHRWQHPLAQVVIERVL